MQNEPREHRVEAASAGQWTVLFFFFNNQKDLRKKMLQNP